MPQQWKVHTPTQETVTPLAVNQDDYMRAVTGGDTTAYQECKALFPCGTPFDTQIGARAMQGDLNAGRSLPKETGYAGQKVVILNPTNNIIGPCGEVTYDLLKKLGMNVDLQETDWGTVLQRRNSRKPVDVGGWSIIHTVWPSDAIYTPVTSAILRGQGDKGWFAGEKIEQAAMTKKITRPMIERNTPTNPNIARPTCRMLRTA